MKLTLSQLIKLKQYAEEEKLDADELLDKIQNEKKTEEKETIIKPKEEKKEDTEGGDNMDKETINKLLTVIDTLNKKVDDLQSQINKTETKKTFKEKVAELKLDEEDLEVLGLDESSNLNDEKTLTRIKKYLQKKSADNKIENKDDSNIDADDETKEEDVKEDKKENDKLLFNSYTRQSKTSKTDIARLVREGNLTDAEIDELYFKSLQ